MLRASGGNGGRRFRNRIGPFVVVGQVRTHARRCYPGAIKLMVAAIRSQRVSVLIVFRFFWEGALVSSVTMHFLSPYILQWLL